MNRSVPSSESTFTRTDLTHSSIEELKIVLLQNYLSGSIILGTVVFFISLFLSLQRQDYLTAFLVTALFLILFVVTFVRRMQANVRALILSLLFIAAGILTIFSTGINSNAILYFFASTLLMAILLPRLWWVAGLVFEGFLLSIMGLSVQFNLIQLNSLFSTSNSLFNWFATITMTLFMVFVFVSPLAQYLSILRSQKINLDIEKDTYGLTEERLNDRIFNLETEIDKRRSKMIAARQVSREISQQNVLEEMLTDSVDLICTQFEFYYAAVFLSDERNEFAVLRAASGEAGKQLLAQGHKLRIREEGIVGYVIARGETRLALDVGEDSVHFKNPLLPETKSEVGIPLKIGTKIIGALDVQSDKETAFSDEDIDILQSIADQLASAIDRSSYISELESQVKELMIGTGETTRGVWRSHLVGSKRNLAYTYRDDQVTSDISTPLLTEYLGSPDELNATENTVDAPSSEGTTYDLPIKLRDQVIGLVRVKYGGKRMPVRMVNLVNTATNRLAVALENARLLENIQERAEREHTVSEISSKVRSSQTIDQIMQTAISELGKTLGVNEVSIQLRTTENTDQD